ncbi:hypothetical protein V6D52_13145 [Idiomarina loihiensis]|uniref:hypothetical protein n=1 Tax=Idiomarina loihiensis TaxID=135577 RepID=UPI0039BEC5F6
MYKQASRRYLAHELSFSEPAKIANKIIGSLDFKEPTSLGHMSEEAVYQFIQSQPIVIEHQVGSKKQPSEDSSPRRRGGNNSAQKERTAVFVSGWSSLKLAAKLNVAFTPVIWTHSSEKSKELFTWSDLLRCFSLVDGKSYGRLFLLMKKYCPEDVANAFLGGKVTQKSLLKFLPCARNTLQLQINAEKEKERPPISKPQLVNMGFGDS